MATCLLGTDVANKAYVDSITAGLPSNSTLNTIATNNLTSAAVNFNNQKITNLALCSSNLEGANK